ncbi:MAG: sugar phosphate nucleotidyltransferase [Conexivisphaerales archaeon]
MQAAVLAGGLGTRLGDLTKNLPKPMIPINGKPFLEYKIQELKEGGVDEIVLCVGYLADKIVNHFGDGARYGVKISYSYDGERLKGVIGALRNASKLLKDEFIITYADNYLRLNYADLMRSLLESGRLAVMAVYHNYNRYGKSDVKVKDNQVVYYSKHASEKEGLEWINYGAIALRKKALKFATDDSEEGFFAELIARKEILAYEVKERFYEIGTHEGLKEFQEMILAHGLEA